MKKMRVIVLIPALFFLASSFAANVDTVSIYSKAMDKTFKCVVIMPDVAAPAAGWPVVYLLHGYGGDYGNWIKRVPALKQHADNFQVMIVCPDGGYSSWYLDSPADPAMRYETYIAREVPAYIDAHFPTIKDRKARAITGLSMGGHGGLLLAFRNAKIFGACGSMSGGVDLYSTKTKFDVNKRIGDTTANADAWKDLSVMNIVERYPPDSLSIIFDCGVDDFFFEDNRRLHLKMQSLKIPHDYTERPGKHDWNYWSNSVQFHLLFFSNYFRKNIVNKNQ